MHIEVAIPTPDPTGVARPSSIFWKWEDYRRFGCLFGV